MRRNTELKLKIYHLAGVENDEDWMSLVQGAARAGGKDEDIDIEHFWEYNPKYRERKLGKNSQTKQQRGCPMKPAKILFLDFDDVLNTRETLARGELFEPLNVAALNAIVDRTDVEIVVTSMWRLGASGHELEELLVEAGVHAAGRVIGTTPFLADRPRGAEILAWLDQSQVPVEGFVILDDRSDMEAFTPYLVQTDPARGLVSEQAEEVVHRLCDAKEEGSLPQATCAFRGDGLQLN
jgi:hypothetical protein